MRDLYIGDEATMAKLGEQIARILHGNEVIELIGDVGAGKTVLSRSILRAAGVTDAIQSPTFTICNRYEVDGQHFAHYDFYRLGEAGIMQAEFIETINDPQTVSIIEWGDIVSSDMPSDRLTIEISTDTELSRRLKIIGHGKLKHIEDELA